MADRELLALALGAAHMGTWHWDVRGDRLLCDPQMQGFMGIDPGNFGGGLQDFLQHVHVDDRGRVAEAMGEYADYEGEFRVVPAADGRIRHLRARSKVIGDPEGDALRVIGVACDITARKQMEEQTAEEHLLLRAMMDYIPDKIYFKDTASRFVSVNQAKLAKHGLTHLSEMLGKTDFDFFTEDRAQKAFEDEQRIMRSGEPLEDHEEEDVWPDGTTTWVSTTKLPFRDGHGSVIGTFGLSHDITQRKHAEEQLARSTEELRAQNQVLQEDLEMARELQSAMLPQRYPTFPHLATIESSALHFYHYYHPSMSVGGDFFDILDISDDAAGVFICDVMGHGVRAALVAATLRTLVGELRSVWMKPAEFLTQLNRGLRSSLKNTDVTLFATAFYMVIDLAQGKLDYANAGHPHPMRVHGCAGTREVTRLNASRPGPALGLIDEFPYTNCQSELSLHDVLLIFTDGLFEVEGIDEELFDYPRLLDAVSQRSDLPTDELCHGVIEEALRFSASKEFSDDVCLVATKIDRLFGSLGPPAPPL